MWSQTFFKKKKKQLKLNFGEGNNVKQGNAEYPLNVTLGGEKLRLVGGKRIHFQIAVLSCCWMCFATVEARAVAITGGSWKSERKRGLD